MFTIFPFETEFYQKHNFEVEYVGNPTLDSIAEFRNKALSKKEFLEKNKLGNRPVVALLAGSRVQEVKHLLPLMIKIAEQFRDFQFVIAGVTTIGLDIYNQYIQDKPVKLIFGQTYDILNNAHTALVASGTASLETALFDVPQTVIYKMEGGWLIDVIFRNFVLKSIAASLPSIIMNKVIIKEFIQMKMTFKNVKAEMEKLLYDENYRKQILTDYQYLKEILGETGSSKRAAQKIVTLLNLNP
jgi:lipid-A-disaccharide synthase